MGTNSRDCLDNYKYSNLKMNEVDGSTDLDFALKKKVGLQYNYLSWISTWDQKHLNAKQKAFLYASSLCPLTDFECLEVL